MEYKYNKNNINQDLIKYIESTIFPKYELNEAAHNIKHILSVINRSFEISKNYDIDLNLVYVIAAYHDIGHHIDRNNHEKISADIIIKDENLNNFFTKEELCIIKDAIEDHRASTGIEPRNIYGKIVSAADKNLTIDDAISRTYFYTKKHNPNFSEQEVLEEIYNHLDKKFGKNGYAKIYIKDEQFENFKKELILLLKDKTTFFEKVNEVLKTAKGEQ